MPVKGYQRKITVEEVIGLSLRRLQELGVIRRYFPKRGQLTYEFPRPFGWLTPHRQPDGILNYRTYWSPEEMFIEFEELGTVEFCTSRVFIKNSIRRPERLWFKCPLCQGRVGKLYFFPYQTKLACRYCHDLTYKSIQNRRRKIETITRMFRGAERMIDNRRSLRDRWRWHLRLQELQPKLDKIAGTGPRLGSLD